MANTQADRIAILGGSRGLGAAFADEIQRSQPESPRLILARRPTPTNTPNTQVLSTDFAHATGQSACLEALVTFSPTRLFYFAGGGPYGPFGTKEWKDHVWALEVSFHFAARVLHWACQRAATENSGARLQQVVFLGSTVAEDQPDPGAASYAGAKHALKGLIASVRAEGPPLDIRLFSPGYMDTALLPPHARPRQLGLPLLDTLSAAARLWKWAKDPEGEWHFRLTAEESA